MKWQDVEREVKKIAESVWGVKPESERETGVKLTLYPNQYRSEVETSGSSDIAVAACRQQRRAKSAGVAHPSAEWGRLSL